MKFKWKNGNDDIWVNIALVFLGICAVVVIIGYELADTIFDQSNPAESILIWHKMLFYIFCGSVIMIYFSLFKAFSFIVREEGIMDYNYIRFLEKRGQINNPLMLFYLKGRLLIILIFIILYWVIIGRLLSTFRAYQIVLHTYVIINMLIITFGEIGRFYYIKKAKQYGCPPEKDIEKNKAIKNMDKIMYILFIGTCLFALFFMYGAISFF